MPHGVLFRGNAEADIRRNLIRKGYIKGIIGLPANLFYGTGIPACIIVIDKREANARKGIFMIDASNGFIKEGPKNRLRSQDIHKIVDVFNKQEEIPGYSKIASYDKIEKNEFNLNLPRYIDSRQAEDIQDIEGHLQGGIPVSDIDALQEYWDICPDLRQALFTDNRPEYVDLTVDKSEIKSAIYEHPEFVSFIDKMNKHFNKWKKKTAKQMRDLSVGDKPRQIIGDYSEGLLAHYSNQPLIDHYDVYQHLMDYWSDVMQDDVYQIAADGWKAETYRVLVKDKKGKEKDKGWACDLVPKQLIVARYFADQQTAIDKLQAQQETVEAKKTELEEEHSGEEGLLSELDKINKSTVAARQKEIEDDSELADEIKVLKQWIKHSAKEAKLKKQIKEAEAELDDATYTKYPKLTEKEVKTLVVDDKWMATMASAIHSELDRISQALTQRVKELAESYETPLSQLSDRVADFEEKVNGHLKRMGFNVTESKLAEVGM